MELSYKEIRAQICDVCHKMWQLGWVASNDGNVSVKLSDGTEGYLYAQYVTVTSGDINSVKKEETTDPSTLTEAEQKAKSVLDTIGWDLRAAYN